MNATLESPVRQRLHRGRRVARWAAAPLLVAAALASLGLVTGLRWLVEPILGWPPIDALGVVTFGVLSGCVLAMTLSRPLRARALVLAGLILALSALAAALTPDAERPWLQTSWTATVVLLLSAAALAGGAFGKRPIRHLMLGSGGFILISVGLTALFVRAAGAFDFGDRGFSAVSIPFALGAMLLGASYLALVWADDPASTALPKWVSVAVALAGVAASVFLWRALVVREEQSLELSTRRALTAQSLALQREVRSLGRVLNQFVAWDANTNDGDPAVLLPALVRDVPAASVVAVLDSNGIPTVMIPSAVDSMVLASALPVRAIQQDGVPVPVALIPLPNDTARFVIHASQCSAGACRGGVAAIVTGAGLLQRTLGERSSGWTFSVGAPRSTPQAGEYRRFTSLELDGLGWVLSAQPTQATISLTRSAIPEIALVLGLVVSGLLYVTVQLGDTAWSNARTVERMRLSTALARSTDALWEWDTDVGRLERSPDLWRHLGYDPGTRAQTFDEWVTLIHPDDRDRITNEMLGLAFTERDGFEGEYRVIDARGEWHTVVDRGRAVERDLAGRASRILGITADVTASRRSEQALREVETLSTMGRVAARVAHEINNPLAGIRNAFLLIKDAVPEDHPHRHYVGAIEREVERIATVTKQLYETYRPQAETGGSSLSTVTGDAVALLIQVNRAANVTINVDLAGVPSVLPVSGALLRQIVYNLVQNAVDASPVGGVVLVHGRVNESVLTVRVTDQGEGVPPELRERIFEPFFTTKNASVKTSGMGLGLTMVSRSVAAAGGEIIVADAQGGGAEFSVTLPLTDQGVTS